MTRFELLEAEQEAPAPARELLATWQDFHTQSSHPTRDDFTPFVLKPWLGQIDIYDVEKTEADEGPDFRLRLNGSKTVELTGSDWTGRTARDIDAALKVTLHNDLLTVYDSKAPLSQGIRLFQKQHVTAHRLLLPIFSPQEDGRVAQIFLALFPIF